MSQFTDLVNEYNELKNDIFAHGNFVVIEDGVRMKRYNQLLGYLYPQFRTTDWESPV
jgi:hypothetical protein